VEISSLALLEGGRLLLGGKAEVGIDSLFALAMLGLDDPSEAAAGFTPIDTRDGRSRRDENSSLRP
jgi:hypothetical protein